MVAERTAENVAENVAEQSRGRGPEAVQMERGRERTRSRGFDPAATATAGALALVVWTQTAHPLGSESWRLWADALANEWLIWFTVLYLVLNGGLGLAARLPGRGWRPAAPRWGSIRAIPTGGTAGRATPATRETRGSGVRRVKERNPSVG